MKQRLQCKHEAHLFSTTKKQSVPSFPRYTNCSFFSTIAPGGGVLPSLAPSEECVEDTSSAPCSALSHDTEVDHATSAKAGSLELMVVMSVPVMAFHSSGCFVSNSSRKY